MDLRTAIMAHFGNLESDIKRLFGERLHVLNSDEAMALTHVVIACDHFTSATKNTPTRGDEGNTDAV